MWRLIGLSYLVSSLCLFGGQYGAAKAEEVLKLKSASGAPMRVLLTGDANAAVANVILFAGGDGVLKIKGDGTIRKLKKNFVVRSRDLFAKQGFLAATADAPKDKWEKPGLLKGFRASAEHAQDIEKIAKNLRKINGKPVAVIGTSRGTVSAANAGARIAPPNVSLVVLTSALSVPKNKNGATVPQLALDKITAPVLLVHNKDDICKVTPLSGVKMIEKKLTKTNSDVELYVWKSKKQKMKNPCQALTPHGFLGIEEKVVKQIADWIRKRL